MATERDGITKAANRVAVMGGYYGLTEEQTDNLVTEVREIDTEAARVYSSGTTEVVLEVFRQELKYSAGNDDTYTNRELIFAAKMYLLAGRSAARGEEPGQYCLAAENYPPSWGGKDEGIKHLLKLTPEQMLIRSAALIVREIDRMKRLEVTIKTT